METSDNTVGKAKAPTIFGSLAVVEKQTYDWGTKGPLFLDWGWDSFLVSGYFIGIHTETPYEAWGDISAENICVVEEGSGVLRFEGKEYPVHKGYVFKIFPHQCPVIRPNGTLRLLSVQKPHASLERALEGGERMDELKVVNPATVQELVYEYEALGQELITCAYEQGLGIIKLTFSMDKIPLHRHPSSGRLIRTISGSGYTYVHPELYELRADDFSLFSEDVVHTNGPVPGSVFSVYAFHLPWVPSGIDEAHIGGNDAFVQYEGPQLPQRLWKTKEDFYRIIKKLNAL